MKKLLLGLSAVCFLVAIVVFLVCSIWTGLVMTLILGALIAFDIFLLKNDARWWIVIALLVISIFVMILSYRTLFTRNAVKDLDGITQTVMHDEEEIAEDEELATEESEEEKVEETESDVETEEESSVITVTEYVEVPVEKIVEKRVEVPVEKKVEVEKVVKEYVEVPVVEYVEVEKEPVVSTPSTPTTTVPNYNYNNYGYTGDPTAPTYGYGYNNGYYGDPTGGYNNYSSSSIKISGKTKVTAGDSYTYTISGVSSISRNKLDLPANVSIEKVSGNKVTLYFDDDYTGSYSIGYGSAVIDVKVSAN